MKTYAIVNSIEKTDSALLGTFPQNTKSEDVKKQIKNAISVWNHCYGVLKYRHYVKVIMSMQPVKTCCNDCKMLGKPRMFNKYFLNKYFQKHLPV